MSILNVHADETASIYRIIRNWSLENVLDIVPIKSGTSCQTFVIHTTGGDYVLRCLLSKSQAEQECWVSETIYGMGIGAEVIKSATGEPLVECDGKYYNLQTFLPGNPPDLREHRQIEAVGETVAKLHCTLKNSNCLSWADDRFSTVLLLQRAGGLPVLKTLFPSSVDTMERRTTFIISLEKKLSKNEVIHGDLGAWNMLWDGTHLRIIDFGECRRGDFHFDIAAIICGILSRCESKNTFIDSLSLFLNTYKKTGGYVELHKLHIAIYLWLLRGVLASATMIQDPIQQEKSCSHFTHELMCYERYVKNEVIM